MEETDMKNTAKFGGADTKEIKQRSNVANEPTSSRAYRPKNNSIANEP